jgi:hypothetical protein
MNFCMSYFMKRENSPKSNPVSPPVSPNPDSPVPLRIRIPVTVSCYSDRCDQFKVLRAKESVTSLWACNDCKNK